MAKPRSGSRSEGRTKRRRPGRKSADLSLDLSSLAPLESSVFADGWAVLERAQVVEFAFFDMAPREPSVVARVVIPIETLVISIWPGAQAFYRDVGSWLSACNIQPIRPEKLEVSPQPLPRPATVMRIFRSASEGLLEFHHISPRDVFSAQQAGGGPVLATPVLAVSVPAALQIGLLEWLEANVEALRRRVSAPTEAGS